MYTKCGKENSKWLTVKIFAREIFKGHFDPVAVFVALLFCFFELLSNILILGGRSWLVVQIYPNIAILEFVDATGTWIGNNTLEHSSNNWEHVVLQASADSLGKNRFL